MILLHFGWISSKLNTVQNVLFGLSLVWIYYCKLHLWISLDCVCLWLISHATEMDRLVWHQSLAPALPQITLGGLVAFGCDPHACQHTHLLFYLFFFSIQSMRCWHIMDYISHRNQQWHHVEYWLYKCLLQTSSLCGCNMETLDLLNECRFNVWILQLIQKIPQNILMLSDVIT